MIGVSEAERTALWAVRHAASPALAALPANRRSLQVVEDGCVPIRALDRYLRGVRGAAARHGIEIVAFGHAGDGHVHVNALADTADPGFEGKLAALLDDVTALVAELGGTVSGEHGDGRLRAPLLARTYGEEIATLFRKVKQAFDPRGTFNPGVIVPTGRAAPLAGLKAGASVQPIPADIERQLRDMERSSSWSVPKTALATAPD